VHNGSQPFRKLPPKHSQHTRPTTTQSAPKRRKLKQPDDEEDVALLFTGLFYVEEEDDAPDAEIAAYQDVRRAQACSASQPVGLLEV
jgi:hypothetical protein